MTCREYDSMLSMYVDNQLDTRGRNRVEHHIATCDACRAELAQLQRLGQEIESMKVQPPYDTSLDAFESHVYARIERGLGWILLSISAVLLLGSGAFYLVRDFLLDSNLALGLRVGVAVGIAGLAVLTVATLRHRLVTRKQDKYTEVIR